MRLRWRSNFEAQDEGLEKALEIDPYHVESKEAVAKKHLDLLVVSWEISMWVASGVLVATAPLITTWCQLVRCQRARPWGKAACQNDALLAIPLFVVL